MRSSKGNGNAAARFYCGAKKKCFFLKLLKKYHITLTQFHFLYCYSHSSCVFLFLGFKLINVFTCVFPGCLFERKICPREQQCKDGESSDSAPVSSQFSSLCSGLWVSQVRMKAIHSLERPNTLSGRGLLFPYWCSALMHHRPQKGEGPFYSAGVSFDDGCGAPMTG